MARVVVKILSVWLCFGSFAPAPTPALTTSYPSDVAGVELVGHVGVVHLNIGGVNPQGGNLVIGEVEITKLNFW
jgi:hypothetical protein